MAESSTPIGLEYGPVGYIYHLSSKMPIGPNSTASELIVYDTKDQKELLLFRFVQVKEYGHFGYIEHMNSNKIVCPDSVHSDSSKSDKLVLRVEKDANALFTFDLESYIIMHRNGKYWHVENDKPTPKRGTSLLQKLEVNKVGSTNTEPKDVQIKDTAKFYFGDLEAHYKYPYSERSTTVSHHWKLLQAFIEPKTDRSLEVTYKVGRAKNSSKTVMHAWKVSAEVAYSFIKAGVGYDGSFSSVEASTLTEEKTVALTIQVPKDQTICVWQYVYCIAQYGDEIAFLSNIIRDTDSIDKKPDMLKQPL